MFKKVRFGNVDFQYIETYDTEENAIKGQNGSFVEVILEIPRITRSSITKLKEKSDGSENSFAKLKDQQQKKHTKFLELKSKATKYHQQSMLLINKVMQTEEQLLSGR
jgi:hypothetical protein